MDERAYNIIGFLLVSAFIVSVIAGAVSMASKEGAQGNNQTESKIHYVDAMLFVRDNCTACDKEAEFLESLLDRYRRVSLSEYDVGENESGGLFYSLSKELGFSNRSVPVLVAGNDYYVGFDSREGTKNNIELIIDQNVRRLPQNRIAGELNVTVFTSSTCPHCSAVKGFLRRIAPKYPEMNIIIHEVDKSEEAVEEFQRLAAKHGFTTGGVPVTVVDDWYMIGYGSDNIQGELLESVIQRNIESIRTGGEADLSDLERYKYLIEIPGIGIVDTRDMGVPLSTVVIGFLDGFNPCAFFVLTMLLSFLMYAKSRKRMLLVGVTFIAISAFVYFLAMAAMYFALGSVSSMGGEGLGSLIEIGSIALIGGVIAIIIGSINVKDFFFFKKGISLTIPEDKKPKLYKRMRGLLKSQTLLELMVAAIILAFVANSYELVCTAALPFVYDTLLLAQGFETMTALGFIAIYCLVYIVPLLIIVLLFVKKLDRERMSQSTGEMLKSISGLMMLGFGIFLIINPEVLSNILIIAWLIGEAVGISLFLTWLKRRFNKKKTEDNSEKEKDGENENDNSPA